MKRLLQIAAILLLPAAWALANNITAANLELVSVSSADSTAALQFDLSWDNSFRDAVNWDAAWVFVKVKPTGGDWQHAHLDTAASSHVMPAGFACSVGKTGDAGMGVFIYRNANGTGTASLTDIQLQWRFGDDGLLLTDTFELQVFAVEMVYVPEGAFYLGSGGSESGHFYAHDGSGTPDTSVPYQVGSEGTLTIGQAAGNLWGTSTSGGNSIGTAGNVSADYPKGYGAFYCMKYEISQGQYTDFLNTLTSTQDANLWPNATNFRRNTIGGSAGSRTVTTPARACNYITWMDGCAYADWAGLRPMTELEYEKACRGTEAPFANEFAWGDTSVTRTPYTLVNDGQANAYFTGTASDPVGNLFYYITNDGQFDGPVRVGIFATSSSTRAEAGATYYGILDMSGGMWEHMVTVGAAEGRSFTGTHGDGSLSANGWATNSDWPGYSSGEVTNATGSAFRGGTFSNSIGDVNVCRISNRTYAVSTYTSRNYSDGIRLVRSAQ